MKHAAIGAFLLLIAACGSESSSKTSNVPGEDPNHAMLLGQGYNSVDGSVKGHCVKLGVLNSQSGQLSGSNAEFRLMEITSESSLREALNVSASASFGGLLGRGSARMNFASSVNKNTQSRYLLVHTRVANQIELASSFEFTPDALELLVAGRQNDFMQRCGNEFAYGRRTGGEFFAVFEFELTSEQQERAFSAAIQGSYGGWSGSSKINQSLAAFNLGARTQLRMLRIGGSGALPEIENLSDFAREFTALTSSTNGSPVTLEVITKSYDGVAPVNLSLNPALTIRQQFVVQNLAKSRDYAQEWLNSVRYVVSHPERFIAPDLEKMGLYEDELLRFINRVNDAAVQCFADIFQGCILPEERLPIVTTPVRKQVTCRVVREPVCQVPTEHGCLVHTFVNTEICE